MPLRSLWGLRWPAIAAALLSIPGGPSAAHAFNPADTTNTFDYIVLTADALAGSAQYVATLHPNLRTCVVRVSEVLAAFAGETSADRIQAFAQFAYTRWRVAPTYLLLLGDANMLSPSGGPLPTSVGVNPYQEWGECIGGTWFPATRSYADDGFYVTPTAPGAVKPLMHVGRIPAQNDQDVEAVVTKLGNYAALQADAAWMHRVLLLVGDRDISLPSLVNPAYATLADNLKWNELRPFWSAAQGKTYYSSQWNQYPPNPTAAVKAAWDSGYAFVNAIGNTLDINSLVGLGMWNLPGYCEDTGPSFTTNLATTQACPVVFSSSCFTNWFHRDVPMCIGEDLLLNPWHGASAVVGPTHMIDVVEAYALDRTFCRLMAQDGVKNIGRLLSAAKAQFYSAQEGHGLYADQYVLLGDPAMDIKIAVPDIPSPSAYRTGFEIEESAVRQSPPSAKSSGITGERLRVVSEVDGLLPIEGERMLEVSIANATGTSNYVEWVVQSVGLTITQNMRLSFWMKVPVASYGGSVVVDGLTSRGRLKDRPDIFDQRGLPLSAGVRPPTDGAWHLYYVDLTPLWGETIADVRIRYERPTLGGVANLRRVIAPASEPGGQLLAYVDDVRVSRTEGERSNELFNAGGDEDVDGDGTPDAWTNVAGEEASLNVLSSGNFVPAGEHCIAIQDIYANGEGGRQVFGCDYGAVRYEGQLDYTAEAITTGDVYLRDVDNGEAVLAHEVITTQPGVWQTVSFGCDNPHYLLQQARLALEIRPRDPATPLLVDKCGVFPVIASSFVSGSAGTSGEWSVSPNPARSSSQLVVRGNISVPSSIEAIVFDVAGRECGRSTPLQAGRGNVRIELAGGSRGLGLKPGVHFVELLVDGRARGMRKIVVME